jgi:hypothetical protein
MRLVSAAFFAALLWLFVFAAFRAARLSLVVFAAFLADALRCSALSIIAR